MSRLKKATVLVVVLAAAVVVPGSAAAGPAGPGTGTGSPTSDVRPATADSVTLITGDRVTVHVSPDGSLVGDVHPAPDRGQIAFIQESGPGTLRVFPADAASLVTAGRLDARLFDVAYLLKEGYGDRSRADIPLIASYDQGRRPQAAVTTARATSVRALPAVRGDALAVRKADAPQFWSTMGGPKAKSLGVRKIWLDGKVTATLDESVPQIGVPEAWQAGLTGAGVTVAVLDTGIDRNHPDLADAVAEARDFTGTTAEARDGHGHGTHVASIVAGRGTAAAGRYTGVAKGGRLAVGKVLDDTGTGQWSWVIAGMEWAARSSGAKVISMSLGAPDTPGVDPVEEAVNQLTAETGALFVIAAGNTGPGAQTVGTPGSADAALTVAAVDRTDAVASFSSRGPRLGDYAVKPDIAAPGVNIAAARAAGTSMPGSTPIDANYTRASGTSMATPHVAGVAAILAQQHPDWQAEQMKAALASSAKPLAGADTYAVGAGRVDAAKAVTEQVYATTASLSFGYLKWPYASAEPIARTVTYRNDSETAVTLDLSLQVTDANGTPAQAGTFTVTPAQLTVPARSTAGAVVTFAAGTGPAGRYGGALTATSADGAHTARVALGGYLEPESYDVTVTALDRNGSVPGADAWFNMVIFFDYATGEFHGPVPSGTTTRLPAGNYAANAYISTARPGKLYPAMAQMAIPDLRVTRDAAVTLDSRAAQRLTFAVDDNPTAAVQYRYQHMLVKYPAGGPVTYFSWTMGTTAEFDEVYVSGANTSDKFAFAAQARLKDASGSAYNLAFPTYRRVPDLDYHVRTRDLGRVDTTYRGLGESRGFPSGHSPHIMADSSSSCSKRRPRRRRGPSTSAPGFRPTRPSSPWRGRSCARFGPVSGAPRPSTPV